MNTLELDDSRNDSGGMSKAETETIVDLSGELKMFN
jgi:hypothetical protein